uniref:Ion transport N-terminal domain-containing protein n=1 Tax=Glossina pallidipes TaxID=7398 RepID=A0A1A9ZPC9_GLOPL
MPLKICFNNTVNTASTAVDGLQATQTECADSARDLLRKTSSDSGSNLHKTKSCSCESLKTVSASEATSTTAAAALPATKSFQPYTNTSSGKGTTGDGLLADLDNECLLIDASKDRKTSKSASDNIYVHHYSVNGGVNASAAGDDQRSLHYENISNRYSGVSKQNSYDSSSPQQLSLADTRYRQYLDSTNPPSRVSNSPNSKSSSLAIADDYHDSHAHGDFKHLVVHNFSNSDPIAQTSYSNHYLEDAASKACPLLKSHYSDCNIYGKNELDVASLTDKQQLVNKAYIFKCIASSPSFLKTNKIKEQSRKLRNLSLKTRPTAKKKNQILAKTNAVSDNSLHPGDKYLNLYLVEKRNGQQQQQSANTTFTSPSVASGQQVPSRHSAQYIVNGALKSVYPTYRSSIKSETAVSAILSSAAAAAATANSSEQQQTQKQQLPHYLGAKQQQQQQQQPQPQQQQPHYKQAKINNKGCNLVNNGNKLSVSTNSCNRLHAGSPHAISPKSSLSSQRMIESLKDFQVVGKLLRRDSEDSVRCSYCSVLNVNENDLRISFENTCTDSLVTAFDDEALLICDQGNEMARTKVHFDDVSLYGTPKEEPMPSIPIVSEKVSANFLKSQLQSWFQPTDNRLAMKLFGSRKALVKERIRQKTSGHWVIHPCSSFRFYWDLCMLLLLVANLIILPVAISFFNDDLSTRWIAFNCLSDTIFLIDIVVNFRTDRMSLIKIMKLQDFSDSFQILHAGRALRILRLAKLLSLVRLLRLSRLVRYVSQWEEVYMTFDCPACHANVQNNVDSCFICGGVPPQLALVLVYSSEILAL